MSYARAQNNYLFERNYVLQYFLSFISHRFHFEIIESWETICINYIYIFLISSKLDFLLLYLFYIFMCYLINLILLH